MEHFHVKYKYSKEVASEAMGAWWRRRFRLIRLVLLAMAIVFAVLAIVMKQPAWLATTAVALFGSFSYIIRKNRMVNKEMQDVKTIYHIDSPAINVDIADKVTVKVSNNAKIHTYATMTGYLETKNQIVLMLTSGQTIALPKAGLEPNDPEALKKFLESKGVELRK